MKRATYKNKYKMCAWAENKLEHSLLILNKTRQLIRGRKRRNLIESN